MDLAEMAAIAAVVLLSALGVFQLALALGAPLGHFSWGGQHKVLPIPLRLGSLVSILIYLGMGLVLMERAGLFSMLGSAWVVPLTWVIAGFGALSVAANAISRSRAERLVMTPVALALGLFALAIAMS